MKKAANRLVQALLWVCIFIRIGGSSVCAQPEVVTNHLISNQAPYHPSTDTPAYTSFRRIDAIDD